MKVQHVKGNPYFEIAGDLVAESMALFAAILARRPEVAAFGDRLQVVFDASSATIAAGLLLEDSEGQLTKAVVIERIDVNPASPRFGDSVLDVAQIPAGVAVGPVN